MFYFVLAVGRSLTLDAVVNLPTLASQNARLYSAYRCLSGWLGMQLEIIVKQAVGLKHDGRHCVEFLLDNHAPQRTRWVDDLYDTQGLVVQPKNFHSSRCTITLRAEKEAYKDSFIHLTLFHQRNIRDDKRAAEAHLPFSGVANGFKGWVGLEHKDKYGGKLYIEANLKESMPAPAPPRPKAVVMPSPDDAEIAEQMAILASIQASQASQASSQPAQTSRPVSHGQSVSTATATAGVAATTSPAWPWPDSSDSHAQPSWPDWPGANPKQELPVPPSNWVCKSFCCLVFGVFSVT